jgi:opacity protein-like surface antigen
VVRSRVALTLALLIAIPSVAAAQPFVFTGLVTGHVGSASAGDVGNWTVMGGASMAVVDIGGMGAEIDASHAGDFDSDQFTDSSITTVMLNFVAHYRHQTFRPFVAAGAGLLRVRAVVPGQSATTLTDAAWSAGGGVLYMVNEALGVRGDVRLFRHFGREDGLPLGDDRVLSFVRSSVGLTYSWPMR